MNQQDYPASNLETQSDPQFFDKEEIQVPLKQMVFFSTAYSPTSSPHIGMIGSPAQKVSDFSLPSMKSFQFFPIDLPFGGDQ
jgi:hypothetical protein